MDKSNKIMLKLIFGILIFIFLVLFLKYSFIYLSPFIIAVILASLIDPIIDKLEEKVGLPRGIIVSLVLIVLIAVFVIFIIFGVSQVYLELNKLLQNLPDYNTIGENFRWILNQNEQLQELINNMEISSSLEILMKDNLQMLYEKIRSVIINMINNLFNMLTKLPLLLIIFFLSFIATFFISKDKKLINDFLIKLFPQKWKPAFLKVKKELLESALGLLRAQLILISISGAIAGIGLSILGNPYAFSVGIGAAILDLIPIIGPALIFYPWILYNLLSSNFSHALSLLIIHLILAGVRSGAEGKIIGANIGLHPLSTMIALYVGYRTLGAIGFLVGPSLLIILKALYSAEIIKLHE